jgi:hypothetical protein
MTTLTAPEVRVCACMRACTCTLVHAACPCVRGGRITSDHSKDSRVRDAVVVVLHRRGSAADRNHSKALMPAVQRKGGCLRARARGG